MQEHNRSEFQARGFGHFEKGPDLYYTEISDLNCRIFGIPENYQADMRLSDFSNGNVQFTDPESYHREDLHIINTNMVVISEAMLRAADGGWVRMFLRKERSPDGGVLGSTTMVPLQTLYGGWVERLDAEHEVLRLPNAEELTRSELQLLHAFLHGIPRKLIASGFGVSVKAIEKRLRRIREKMHHPHCCCYSLHGCVNWYGLMQFIMDRDDWFNLTPTYRMYRQ